MGKEELKKYSKMVNNEYVNEVKNTINEVAGVLENIESVKATVPEDIFVNNYLDYFKNIKNQTEESPLYVQWVNIAGSVFEEVDLVNSKGEVVATVPPLVAKTGIEVDLLDQVPFSEIGHGYTMLHTKGGDRADTFLRTELSGLPKCVKSSPAKEHAKRWVKLFKRYENKENLTDDKKPSPGIQKIKEDLGINYDD